MERPRVALLAKIDVPEARDLAELIAPDLEARGLVVCAVSAVSHEGLREFGFILAALVREARARLEAVVPPRQVLRPEPVDAAPFSITRHEDQDGHISFLVHGAKPERWVAQTDFSNDEAIGYLADRLAKLGVEDALVEKGARAGAEVVIGQDGVVFDFEPTLLTGPELLGARGTDPRLADNRRRTTPQRRREYAERMDAKAAARAELWTEREAGHWSDPAKDGP